MKTSPELVTYLSNTYPLADGKVVIDVNGYKIAIHSNNEEILECLGIYFAHTLSYDDDDIDRNIFVYDDETFHLDFSFSDWVRETGKSGRKDAFYDLDDARLIHKVRTGMYFLQSPMHAIAMGPCVKNDNQIINFINAQYMTYLQHQNALICHASAVSFKNNVLAFAGFSGGGKSTLMLHILGKTSCQYVSNDRLFIKEGMAYGIPKLPRVNPGTLLNDKHLIEILPQERIDTLKALDEIDLWDLEEKYDVFIEDIYGEDRIAHSGHLNAFLILNWSRTSTENCKIAKLDLNENDELVQAIMKSPGPFYYEPDGTFQPNQIMNDDRKYLATLSKTPIYVATGKVDFDYASDFCIRTFFKD